MKLYDSTHAPNPRRVRIYLAEKGIEVPSVQIDIGKAENREPEFIAKNPLGKVPILELDDGTIITETIAICRYFEEETREPPLFGIDRVDRALVEMWQRRMELDLFRWITECFRNSHDFFKGRIEQVAEYGEVSRRRAVETLVFLDEELAEREFIAGDRFSVADITALCGIDFGRVTGIKIDPGQKNLSRWYEAVSSRPSAGA